MKSRWRIERNAECSYELQRCSRGGGATPEREVCAICGQCRQHCPRHTHIVEHLRAGAFMSGAVSSSS